MKKRNFLCFLGMLGVMLMLGGCGEAQKAYDEALELTEEGKYEEALPFFEKARKEDEKMEYAAAHGMALNRLGRYEEAFAVLSAAGEEKKASDEKRAQWEYAMSMAEHGRGNAEETLSHCDQALALSGSESLCASAHYMKALAFQQMGEPDKAREECKMILKEDDGDIEALMELAWVERHAGNPEEAIQAYSQVIEKEDDYYEAYFALADAYQENGQEAAAAELLKKLSDMEGTDGPEFLAIGRAYAAMEEFDKAEESFRRAAGKDCREALYFLGLSYIQQGRKDEAAKSLLEFTSGESSAYLPEGFCELSTLYLEMGKYQEAKEALTKGLAYGQCGASAALRKNQVILYEKQGKYEKAKKAAAQYLKVFPGDEGMTKELAFIKTRLK